MNHILGHFQSLENVGWFHYQNWRKFRPSFWSRSKHKKINQLFNTWYPFQNSTPFPNDMLHTQAHTFLSLIFGLKVGTMYITYLICYCFQFFRSIVHLISTKLQPAAPLKKGKEEILWSQKWSPKHDIAPESWWLFLKFVYSEKATNNIWKKSPDFFLI